LFKTRILLFHIFKKLFNSFFNSFKKIYFWKKKTYFQYLYITKNESFLIIHLIIIIYYSKLKQKKESKNKIKNVIIAKKYLQKLI